ncbi:MAG TPA: helix-turn-helix domain-containing protein [Pseudonocardiaceae bacterium]
MTTARRKDAARNDLRILGAAREIFIELGPDAPVSVIAERAGIGIASLYRRYPTKEDLMRELLLRTIEETGAQARRALAADDAWVGFRDFVLACVAAGVSGAPREAKSFLITEEILDASRTARQEVQRLVDRAQVEGGLRPDVNAHDIVLLLTELRVQRRAEGVSTAGMRRRLVGIVLDGLRAENASELSDAPATWSRLRLLWRRFSG